MNDTPVGRRVILGMLGLGAGGIVWGSKAQDLLERILAPLTNKDGTGLAGVLPVGRFRFYSVVGFNPKRSTDEYRLAVSGMVDQPFVLTYAELRDLEHVRLTKDFQCVTGWRVRDVAWKGVLLRTLLEKAGVQPGAKAITFRSFDGEYTESLTLEQAKRSDVIVAYELEHKRISAAHGGPVRLYVAPMYGYKSLKWLESIEVVPKVETGYWELRGYDDDAWIGRSNGRDDAPV